MNSNQNTRTNRDQDQIEKGKAGISPTTQAAAEQSAADNPEQRYAAAGPLKDTGDKLSANDTGDGQSPDPEARDLGPED